MKKSNVVRMAVLVGAVFAGSVSALADADVTLSGVHLSDYSYTAKSATRVILNGVAFTNAQLKLAGNVDFTLVLQSGTKNTFYSNDSKLAPIKATKQSNIIVEGLGKLRVEAKKRMDADGGVFVCSNLTVKSGDVKVTFDNDKSDSPCIFLKGSYLQTGGEVSLDSSKKNCTNELYGMQFDTRDTSFTLTDGDFSVEVAGTKSRGIDLKKSGVAYFNGGNFNALLEGPNCRAVSGGTLNFNGTDVTISTNVTAKMAAGYMPTSLYAIKSDLDINITDGDFEIDVPTEGSEGIVTDSETNGVIRITGGNIDITSGDDCINAANKKSQIVISGGRVRGVSGDDIIDSNGNVTISGGIVRAFATVPGTHGIDVNTKAYGAKVIIDGGNVIATDGADAEVETYEGKQKTYVKNKLSVASYAGKYLVVPGKDGEITKTCLPTSFGDSSTFRLIVSVPGLSDTWSPAPKTVAEAYADANSETPLVFERKAKVDGQTVTTKEGAVLTLPDYYYLDPAEGKTKTVALYLNSNAVPEIASIAVGSGVTVGVATKKGLYYQLETASDLSGDWVKAGSKVAGDGSEKPFAATRSGSQGFYRAVATDIAD